MLIRRLLVILLGFDRYLRFISFVFLLTWRYGIRLRAHEQVRFLARLVQPGATCLDIGANLGYFSIPLSHAAGPNGKVIAVEPVEAFREVLLRNLAHFALPNAEVLPFALGEQHETDIRMGTPRVDGVVRHGRTEVLEGEGQDSAFVHTARMMRPDRLFASLARLDFLKCDVEGYELHIMPHLLGLLERFGPVVEIEATPTEHKKALIDMLAPLQYQPYFLSNEQLYPFRAEHFSRPELIELYFLTPAHRERLSDLIAL